MSTNGFGIVASMSPRNDMHIMTQNCHFESYEQLTTEKNNQKCKADILALAVRRVDQAL